MRTVRVKMDMYNTFRRCREDEVDSLRNRDGRVDPFMAPLIAELSKKRPAWAYESEGFGDLSPCGQFYMFNRFTIIEGDDTLGEISSSRNWRTNERRFAFDNQRLRAVRKRGANTETKDLKKAVKLILGNMYVPTLGEVMDGARSRSIGKATDAIYKVLREYRWEYDRIQPQIAEFLTGNWEEFQARYPQVAEKSMPLPELLVRKIQADEFARLKDNGRTALIVERNGTFHVELSYNKGTYLNYTLDTLPTKFRQAVGILRLVDVDGMVDGIGVRADTKTYFVLDGGDDGN
jgi:hypothetical protein